VSQSDLAAARGARAGFGSRLVASLIDVVPFALVGVLLLRPAGLTVAYVVATGSLFAYFAFLEGGPSGQTVGKRVMGIRVADIDGGGQIGTSRALVRAIGRYVSAVACMLGYLWMLWDGERQTWHDKLADSIVVPASADSSG
jgi:uncharacterized RDD family membrane protein YckC